MSSALPPGGVDAREVQDRQQLAQYLARSLTGDYLMTVGEDELVQTSTFVKSYVVEAHTVDHDQFVKGLRSVFSEVLPRAEPQLWLLFDDAQNAYFCDILSPRFVVIHTTAKTDATDAALQRLTERNVPGFDRVWMPTQFLRNTRRGRMTGFKFGFEPAVQGIVYEGDEFLPSASGPSQSHRERFRMYVAEDRTAEQSYRRIWEAPLFLGRKALEHIQFIAMDDADRFISDRVFANGKIIGNGTSIGSHLLTVEKVLTSYSDLLARIEDHCLGWVAVDGRIVHRGEPFLITFPEDLEIVDLPAVAHSIVRPTRPFRLLGIPHGVSENRVDVEAIDLHTGDAFALEFTKEWMRVYLPRGTCGNVVTRLFSNLQHSFHSGVQLTTGSGELLFIEESSHED